MQISNAKRMYIFYFILFLLQLYASILNHETTRDPSDRVPSTLVLILCHMLQYDGAKRTEDCRL